MAASLKHVHEAHKARGIYQRTLSHSLHLSGIGLHSGQRVDLWLHPADDDTGICFLRSDLQNGARRIQARAQNVTNTHLCTQLTNDQGGSVSTIEHLMAALHGMGLHNVLIELDGPEIPILDGSSQPFTTAIEAAGLHTSTARARGIVVREDVEVKLGSEIGAPKAKLSPRQGRELWLDVSIDFDAPCIGQQSASLLLNSQNFVKAISGARTFGFAEQLETLQGQGRALGGSVKTAILIAKGVVQNPKGLRFENEFARHKLLDAVGDLYIEGLPIFGTFTAHKGGHRLTNKLMRTLMARPKSFEIVEI